MLKVVIFDSGWGGELVADYIEEELNIIDVIRVIDWRHAPYEAKGQLEICCLVEAALKPYIGRVEVVVLASFEAGLALDYLKEAYPEQKFVKMPFDLWEIKHSKLKPHRVMILAGQKLQRKQFYQQMVQELQVDRVVELDGQGWAALIDEGEMTQELLAKELADYVEAKIDVVVLANTHFWDIKEELQQILGWQVYIIDQREELLYELCNALELRGIDGRRRK